MKVEFNYSNSSIKKFTNCEEKTKTAYKWEQGQSGGGGNKFALRPPCLTLATTLLIIALC